MDTVNTADAVKTVNMMFLVDVVNTMVSEDTVKTVRGLSTSKEDKDVLWYGIACWKGYPIMLALVSRTSRF